MHFSHCKEKQLDATLKVDGICKNCHGKYDMRRNDEPCFHSAQNHVDFGEVPFSLPLLEPLEEMFIARVHVSVKVITVKTKQVFLVF